ncbi:hypothetical protein [Flavihumibacter fluvii]|uniref:hypothetical protein n=1 Tax=Flavihumibacter fluvii TaxID=2838157 RepID=UPI001BDF4365|nr:hypothetical protein [Flavihumibacter fluvii]ULQ53758.1 hypothetical protein KJS93_05405 [Flavihumibacter fluvii]
MPNQGFIINLIDNLTLLTLIIIALFLLYKRAWINRPMSFILINVCYSISLFIVGFWHPISSKENEIISNLTMHVDTFSGLGFLYYLWIDNRYRKFLLISVVPIILVWLTTFIIKQELKIYSWNLILPSLWFLAAAQYSMVLLYRKSSFQDTAPYASRFLLITGFMFYNFIYLVVEICYLYFTSISNITDAWNINYWAYFIFRIMMLAGVIAWYGQSRVSGPVLAEIRK